MIITDYDILVYNIIWILQHKKEYTDTFKLIDDVWRVVPFISYLQINNSVVKFKIYGIMNNDAVKVKYPDDIDEKYRNYFRITLDTICKRMEINIDGVRERIEAIVNN